MKKKILIINSKYKLSDKEKSVKNSLIRNKVNCYEINSKKKQTSQIRKEFENVISEYDEILIFNVYHISVDIRYLTQIPKDIYILKREDCFISNHFETVNKDINRSNKKDFFNHSFIVVKDFAPKKSDFHGGLERIENLFKIKYDAYKNTLKDMNKELLKLVQEIGRLNKKEKINSSKSIKYKKSYNFGRPKKSKSKSQYDRDKELIRYRLEKNMKIVDIHNDLGYGSITALRYYIQTRFRKNYIK